MVERFIVQGDHAVLLKEGGIGCITNEHGPFVRHSDFAALKAENERLTKQLAQMPRYRENLHAARKYAEARAETAERALAERAGGVKVKPLEFNDRDEAHTVAGWYFVEGYDDGTFGSYRDRCGLGNPFGTLAEAKAAAQADYERRILSAITTEPAAPEIDVERPERDKLLELSREADASMNRLRQAIPPDVSAAYLYEALHHGGGGWRPAVSIDHPRNLPVDYRNVRPVYADPAVQASTDEPLRHAVEFTARWCWRSDPPNASNKLTDAERLSAIKYHPTIKAFGEPHAALAQKEEGR